MPITPKSLRVSDSKVLISSLDERNCADRTMRYSAVHDSPRAADEFVDDGMKLNWDRLMLK